MMAFRLWRCLGAGLASALAVSGWLAGARAQELSGPRITAFLVQCIEEDRSGQPRFPSPSDPDCPTGSLPTVATPLAWRKHDFPGESDRGKVPLGYQISDSVLDPGFDITVAIQTFDFGEGDRRFGSFDSDDGGDALAVLDGEVYGFYTQDGGNGKQWFVGEACRTEARPRSGLKAWLFFASDVVRGEWRERVARLNIARAPDACPARFGSAYTRYRRDTVEVPFRLTDASSRIRTWTHPVDTILSEHYGGRDIERADHLERFYFGRGLGKYRWERWEKLSRSLVPNAADMARDVVRGKRCMPLAYSDAPGEGWAMVDCRTWTNLVREKVPVSARDFGWPGKDLDPLR